MSIYDNKYCRHKSTYQMKTIINFPFEIYFIKIEDFYRIVHYRKLNPMFYIHLNLTSSKNRILSAILKYYQIQKIIIFV